MTSIILALIMLLAFHPTDGGSVVINEIAWSGTATSHTHEWIELHNPTGNPIDIAGWTLIATDGTPAITLNGTIPAGGYYLLKRTGENTRPEVPADLIYTGALGDAGETLTLSDPHGNPIDVVDCAAAGWYVGHAPGRIPMARLDPHAPGADPNNWTHAPRCGTPTNSSGISHTCALTTTYTGYNLDYTFYTTVIVTATTPTTTLTTMERALLHHISTTQTTLDAALYGLNRQSIVDALIAAHQRGISVRIVADDDAVTGSYQAAYAQLSLSGITVITDSHAAIQHNKFFVFDHAQANARVWTGSTNLTDNGFTMNANHSLIITSTHLASIYTAEFNEMWAGNFHTAKTTPAAHRLDYNGIRVDVYFSPNGLTTWAIWEALATAEQQIACAMFFWTDAILADRAIQRLNAGTDLAGVWDNLGASNAASQHERLTAAGARIRRENFPGLVHHKLAVLDPFDDTPVTILGSFNWTASAAYANDENLIIIYDPALAAATHAEINALWQAINPTATRVVRLTAYSPYPAVLSWMVFSSCLSLTLVTKYGASRIRSISQEITRASLPPFLSSAERVVTWLSSWLKPEHIRNLGVDFASKTL